MEFIMQSEQPWLKNYPSYVPHHIDVERFASLPEMFNYYLQQHHSFTAFSNFGVSLTYQQLDRYSGALAAYLQTKLKLVKGERVAIMMPNLLQYPVALFGVLRAGLVVVNVNPLYTAYELEHMLKDSGATTLIVLDSFAHTVQEALQKISLKNIIITRVGDLLGPVKGTLFNFTVKFLLKKVPTYHLRNSISFKTAIHEGKQLTFNSPVIKANDLAFLQYTGGTTGTPKGAMLTHGNMVANVLQCSAWVGSFIQAGKDLAIGALPFYHIFALTVCGLCFMTLGAECSLITNPRDIEKFIRVLIKRPPTIFIGVNTLFNLLMHHDDFQKIDFTHLKLTIAGGMALQQGIVEKWKSLTNSLILEGYGLTEASPVVAINPINQTVFNGSVGLPVPNTELKMCDDHGNEVADQAGELCVKGPQVMAGYWNKPQETADVLSPDGWLRTGDIARIDEDGYVYIVDRKKDMILVSGFNVFPNEVEEVIGLHPGIKEAAVIGVPNENSGEVVKAFVVKNNKQLTEADVIAHCQKYLTKYKIPKIIEFREELPKTNVGKILRRELR